MKRALALLFLAVSSCVVPAGNKDESTDGCPLGDEQACLCTDGKVGRHVCGSSGTYSDCGQCGEPHDKGVGGSDNGGGDYSTGGNKSVGGSSGVGGAEAICASGEYLCSYDDDRTHCCSSSFPFCGPFIGQCSDGEVVGDGTLSASECTSARPFHCANDGGYCCGADTPFCAKGGMCTSISSTTKGTLIGTPAAGTGGSSGSAGASGTGGHGLAGSSGASGSADSTGGGTCDPDALKPQMQACARLIDMNDAASTSCAGACTDKLSYACGETQYCGEWKANCDAYAAVQRKFPGSGNCNAYCPANCH